MALTVNPTPGFSLQPTPSQVATPGSYISNFDFLSQYLPDTHEAEFERYGNRSISSFLRLVGAEMPSNSDLIKWSEQGRLHIKYTSVTSAGASTDDTAVFTVGDAGITASAIRVGQTVMISDNTAASTLNNKGIVTAVSGLTFTVAFYEAAGQAAYAGTVTVFIYGSEFKKGSNGMEGALEAESEIFENSPIIIKDKYTVSGSDMAQIGWVEVTTENGANGYLWYLKSEHETRLRFEDYLETAMIEAVPAETGSGAIAATGDLGNKGSEGLLYVLENRGNVAAGALADLTEWDAVVARLDKQGSIEENVLFVDRDFSFEIDNMLAAQNNFGSSGASYGLFDNDTDMALNLGFSGFRRGYDFYKSDWKYLNDATMRGGITGGAINGVLVPAGSTSVYDQVMGKNAKRPFLHVRYRASEAEDRKMKSWVVGSAGGASNSDKDAMEVHFLSERALCTLGANNFFLFK
tara:strand:+ start:9480 stop:10871 length:1392 start_codon:yes stop_codon:yes gene_type:complete